MLVTKKKLIIDAYQLLPFRQRALSWLLTLFGWGVWIYLWLPALAFITLYLSDHAWRPPHAEQAQLLRSLDILQLYLLIATGLGATLVLWSRIHYWRFAGVDRRAPVPDMPLAEVAEATSLPTSLLSAGQRAQILVVFHRNDGGLDNIDVKTTIEAKPTSL